MILLIKLMIMRRQKFVGHQIFKNMFSDDIFENIPQYTRCISCNWEGYDDELSSGSSDSEMMKIKACCPECGSENIE